MHLVQINSQYQGNSSSEHRDKLFQTADKCATHKVLTDKLSITSKII